MVRLWSEVLRVDRVGIHDNFFELGGDSLQVAILLNQLLGCLGTAVHAAAGRGVRSRAPSPRLPNGSRRRSQRAARGDSPSASRGSPGRARCPCRSTRSRCGSSTAWSRTAPAYMLLPGVERQGAARTFRTWSGRRTRSPGGTRSCGRRFPEVNGSPMQVIAPAASLRAAGGRSEPICPRRNGRASCGGGSPKRWAGRWTWRTAR